MKCAIVTKLFSLFRLCEKWDPIQAGGWEGGIFWGFFNRRERTSFLSFEDHNKTLKAHTALSRATSVSLFDSKWLEFMMKFKTRRSGSVCFKMPSKRQSWSRKKPPCFTAILQVSPLRRIAKLRLDFLARDNVLEVALGLIIGGAFTTVVTSLVSDMILPPISLITQSSKNLANYFIVLRPGETPDAIYNTVEQAAEDGKRIIDFTY